MVQYAPGGRSSLQGLHQFCRLCASRDLTIPCIYLGTVAPLTLVVLAFLHSYIIISELFIEKPVEIYVLIFILLLSAQLKLAQI